MKEIHGGAPEHCKDGIIQRNVRRYMCAIDVLCMTSITQQLRLVIMLI